MEAGNRLGWVTGAGTVGVGVESGSCTEAPGVHAATSSSEAVSTGTAIRLTLSIGTSTTTPTRLKNMGSIAPVATAASAISGRSLSRQLDYPLCSHHWACLSLIRLSTQVSLGLSRGELRQGCGPGLAGILRLVLVIGGCRVNGHIQVKSASGQPER